MRTQIKVDKEKNTKERKNKFFISMTSEMYPPMAGAKMRAKELDDHMIVKVEANELLEVESVMYALTAGIQKLDTM